MVISEENKTSLLEDSLSSQLEQASLNQQANSLDKMPDPINTETTSPLDPGIFGAEEIQKVEQEAYSAQQAQINKENSQSDEQLPSSSFDFLNDSDLPPNPEIQTQVKSYNSSFYYSVLGTVLCSIVAIGSGVFNRYLQEKSRPNTESPHEYVETFSNHYDEYGQMLGIFDIDTYKSTDLTTDGKNKIKNLISAPGLNYPQKKDLLQETATDFGQKTIELKKEIKTITDQLNKDVFFPEELVTILKENNSVSSIQRSLLSLEVVKFSSAMKVFSLMDVFLTSLSNELSIPKSEIKQRLNDLLSRGENDVKNYLNYCYNNPYEPANCNIIGDFDTYYRLNKNKQSFDSVFFKTMMDMIDRKLESAQLPSFSITFNDFDSKNGDLSFSVEVNTLKEDEYALIKEGIKNPHIFIVSELIKLLKQSTFILGKSIDMKEMQVSEKEEEIGGVTYKYHTSSKSFTLPIQKNTKREIFDYVDSYKTLLDEQEHTQENSSETFFDKILDFSIDSIPDTDEQTSTGSFLNSDLVESPILEDKPSNTKKWRLNNIQTSWSHSTSTPESTLSKSKTGESTTKLSTSAVNQASES